VARTDARGGLRPVDVPGTTADSTRIRTDGIELHAAAAGPEDGPLAVLLHGFPECWYGWHRAIEPFVDAGYRVVVPDQRGYNASEKPDGIAAYRIRELAADVAELIDHCDRETAAIVGHDWGGTVGWWLAASRPSRVSRLVAVNAPHPSVMERTLRESWTQRLRSWYVLAFQVPLLPEAVSRLGDWRLVVRMMRESSRPGTFSGADFERYRTAWSSPGAFRAMLNWYRAAARERPSPRVDRIEPPTLVIWGACDRLLERSMARGSVDRCVDGRLAWYPEGTHWVHHEEPAAVAADALDHLDAA